MQAAHCDACPHGLWTGGPARVARPHRPQLDWARDGATGPLGEVVYQTDARDPVEGGCVQQLASARPFWIGTTQGGGAGPRIYDKLGLAPTISTTSAVYVWHDGTQARLLQVRELARLQGLPDNFVLPEGRVVATRLIGNAVPPALIRALLL